MDETHGNGGRHVSGEISTDTVQDPDNNQNSSEENTDQPTREITQTDHLNKRLLSAFLDRINQSGEEEGNSDEPIESDNIEWEEREMCGKDKVIIIGISGTTNSGKSTLAERLVGEIPNSVHVCQDHYFLPPGDPRLSPLYIPELDHHNWEDYRALEMDKLVDDIKVMISKAEKEDHTSVILMDGFSIFGWRPLTPLLDKKYFLSVEKNVCFERRKKRCYDPPDVPGYFEQCAWPKHLEHLKDIADQEDIVYFKSDETMDAMALQIKEDLNNLLGSQKKANFTSSS